MSEPNQTPRQDGTDDRLPARDPALPARTGAAAWWDNFWYHYKVPALIALVALIAIVICVVQICRRTPEADLRLVYAGSADLRATASRKTAEQMAQSLSPMADSAVGKQNATVRVDYYQILTGDAYVPSPALNQQNKQNLKNELDIGDSYLFLLSEDLFSACTAAANGDRYVRPLSEFLPDRHTLRLTADGYGVYLDSTPLASLPGFCDLPADTVLCLRVPFTVSNLLGGNAERVYARYEALFRLMLGV